MLKYEKERFDLIAKIEKQFVKRVTTLQRILHRELINYYESKLIINNNVIAPNITNIRNAGSLAKVQLNFQKTYTIPLVRWMARQLISVLRPNRKHFTELAGASSISKVQDKVEAKLLAQYGISIKDKVISIKNGSLLSNLSNIQDPYNRVRQIATQAAKRGVPLKDFKAQVRTYILPDKRLGPVANHFMTNANDVYSKFDRSIQTDYATELGYRVFIYSGGLIQTSRKFPCEEYNGKTLTVEEWDNIYASREWPGKIAGGDSDDMGGHNCRHFKSYISDKAAIRRRPELKDILK